MTKKLPLVVVTWVDSTSHYGWLHGDEVMAKQMAVIATVGYLVSATRKEVRLVRSFAKDGGVGDLMLIPKSGVLKVTKIRS